jgi:signal transduction histidine kinase
MRDRTLSLRSILSTTTGGLLVLALLVAGTLVALSAILNQKTRAAVSSVDSVWLAQQAQIDVLVHERTNDPIVRHELEDRIRAKLEHARRLASSEAETDLTTQASKRLAEYAESEPGGRELARVELDRALDALIAFNVDEAKEAEDDAATWSRVGTVAGIGVAALLLVASVALIAWFRHAAVVPMMSLAGTMERFEAGEREARAMEAGPAEVRDMSRRFNQLAAALGAQRRAQIAFVGGVAHDLRNPLTLLKLSLGVVDPEGEMPPEPVLRRVLEKVQRQVNRLERMVSDFLEVAKTETSELQLVLGTHDANTIARDAVDLFTDAVAGQRFQLTLPDQPTPIRCDALRMEQVVTNLISNAVKYSPGDTPVEVVVADDVHSVRFEVRDHGTGLTDGDKRHIFEPFQRAGIGSHLVPGVGLGLSVVRRIVLAHGGRIEVDSAPGKGSTFRVVLQREAS